MCKYKIWEEKQGGIKWVDIKGVNRRQPVNSQLINCFIKYKKLINIK